MSSEIRVNIGCGATPTPGWLNFDNSSTVLIAQIPVLPVLLRKSGLMTDGQLHFSEVARTHHVRWADATKRVPLADGTAAVCYASHVLEHMDRQDALRFVHELRRVLRAGGVLRLAVPDLKLLVEQYAKSGDADRFINQTHMSHPRPRGLLQRVKLGVLGPRHHAWMYDGKSLKRLLEEAGFIEARVMPAGKTTIPNPGALDLREREDESVYLEAVKP